MKHLFFILMLLVFTAIARADVSHSVNTRTDYTVTSVGTSSWVELYSSLPASVYKLTIFDSSGQTMEIGTGSAGNESRLFILPPGGGEFALTVSAGTRVSIRAITGTASAGENDINFFY